MALAAGGLLFLVLATANGGGYRYGVSDQAFWIPAAVRALQPASFPRDAGLIDAPEDSYPPTLAIALEKVETLRYGENPHQPAARYRRPGSTLADGLFGIDASPLQGKALSYSNVLDAAAAAA